MDRRQTRDLPWEGPHRGSEDDHRELQLHHLLSVQRGVGSDVAKYNSTAPAETSSKPRVADYGNPVSAVTSSGCEVGSDVAKYDSTIPAEKSSGPIIESAVAKYDSRVPAVASSRPRDERNVAKYGSPALTVRSSGSSVASHAASHVASHVASRFFSSATGTFTKSIHLKSPVFVFTVPGTHQDSSDKVTNSTESNKGPTTSLKV